MKRSRTIGIIVAISVVVAAIVILISSISGPKNEHISWRETYNPEGKMPYDTYLLANLLEDNFDLQIVEEDPREEIFKRENATYLFIGNNSFTNDTFKRELAEFVAKGNTALIIQPNISGLFAEEIELIGDCRFWISMMEYQADELYMNFEHRQVRSEDGYYVRKYFMDTFITRNYSLIDSSYEYCRSSKKLVPLGYSDAAGYNFFAVPHGKGTVYFHTLPMAFTNINLKRAEMVEYAEKVFSHLPDQPIYYDQYSNILRLKFETQTGQSISPLIFILSQESLRWAWYLLLAAAVLYIIFTAKRRQRIVPVLVPKSNTSLEYAETIGRLYHQQKDHRKLALLQMRQFMTYLHRHLNINTKLDENQLIKEISVKTKQPFGKVEEIFHKYRWIEEGAFINEDTLVDFYKKLENIYDHGRK